MTFRPRLRLPVWLVAAALILGSGWTGWLGIQHLRGSASVLDRAEAVFADLRLLAAGVRPAPADVAIVAIDDATVDAQGGYPIDRASLAELIELIADSGARGVAIDLLFVDEGRSDGDAALASALAAAPTVIAAAGRFDAPSPSAVPRSSDELWPIAGLVEASSVGLVNVATDAGGTPRHVPLVFQTNRGPVPSLVLRAAGLFGGSDPVLASGGVLVDEVLRPVDFGWHLPLRYLGPAGTVDTVSGLALSENRDAVASRLDDRIVVVGATATGVGDRFGTPFEPVLPGVEVLATAIAHLIDGSGLTRNVQVRRIDLAAALVLTIAGVLVVSAFPLVAGLGLFAGLVLGWLGATAIAFAHGYWFSATLPLAGAVPAVGAFAAVRQLHDRRKAHLVARTAETLSRFQAPALARRLTDDPTFLREPVERQAAILFIDLSGFTRLSERLGPARTEAFLREFHSLVVEQAHAHDGCVMSFMGDGAMILFGIPDPASDDAARALDAAQSLVAATRAWIAGRDAGAETPGLRVGAHLGPVILSRLGHASQQHITTTGDSVNVASRLMEVGKANGAVIAASVDLISAAGRPGPWGQADIAKEVAIRGRRAPMIVHLWRTVIEPEGDRRP